MFCLHKYSTVLFDLSCIIPEIGVRYLETGIISRLANLSDKRQVSFDRICLIESVSLQEKTCEK